MLATIVHFAFLATSLFAEEPKQTPAVSRQPFPLKAGEVVGFVGGANVVDALRGGHWESLLALQFPLEGLVFRNLGWEGDTVYAQPRDVNYPPMIARLEQFKVQVLFLDFGAIETLEPNADPVRFQEAYGRLLDQILLKVPRLILLTPIPFEPAGPLLPDLSRRNGLLEEFAKAIHSLGKSRGVLVIDRFEAVRKSRSVNSGGGAGWTSDGLHLTPHGHAESALLLGRLMGLEKITRGSFAANARGEWSNPGLERLRREIVSKNKLWFDYSRPMNWAFLGGDRTEQPSSRDHLNPKIRWFPTEMENFLPLIYQAEARCLDLARQASTAP